MTTSAITPVKHLLLIPTFNRVIVSEDGFHYGGLIHIPDKSKRRPTTGTIVAICPDQQADLGHWVGKRIVFARWSGTGLNFKNRPAFRVLDIQEILAELTETDAELDLDDTSLDQQ